MCLTYYPVTFTRPARPADAQEALRARRPASPRRRDGLVGLGCRHRAAVARLLRDGRPPGVDRGPEAVPRPDRARRRPSTRGSPSRRSRRCSSWPSAFRIPNAPIVNGANAHDVRALPASAAAFVANPTDGATNPASAVPADHRRRRRPPTRSRSRRRRAAVQRAAGARHDRVLGRPAGRPPARAARRRGDPPRVAEAARRRRGSSAACPQTEDQYWERGPIFAALNTNKKSLTIDLGDPRGRRAASAGSSRPATWSSRTSRRACSTSSGSSYDVAARGRGPTSSWCGCRASASTGRGGTPRRSRSSSRTPPG